MIFLIKCFGNEHIDINYAIVAISEETKKEILNAKEVFQMGKSKLPSLWRLHLWSGAANFFESLAEELTEEEEDLYENDCVAALTKERAEALVKDIHPVRTECDQMLISEEGFNFSMYPKHMSYEIETTSISYDLLLKEQT
jgi:hypothetical protein